MSRRGNCHDNTVTESFFNLRKRERIHRKPTETGMGHGGTWSNLSRCFEYEAQAGSPRKDLVG